MLKRMFPLYALLPMLLASIGGMIVIAPRVHSQTVLAPPMGTDYSANPLAIPMTGLVLLKTIPQVDARHNIKVQNQSAATIQIVLDDGAGNNQTSFLIAPGALNWTQGNDWNSNTFNGRIRIYGLSTATVAVHQE